MTPRPCPSCDGKLFDLLFTQAFASIAGAGIVDGYDVVACAACRMVYASEIPSQAEMHTYYATQSKYEYPQRAGAPSEWDQKRFRQVADSFENLMPDREAAILDVGCATGGLIEELMRRGYSEVTGLDPSPACVAAATARGLDVLQGSVASLFTSPTIGKWDVICLVGVLEHIHDVRETLTMLRHLLTPTGLLYVEVPDARGFVDFEDAPFQAFSTEHINFFTMWSLNATLGRAGFQVVDQLEDSREQSATVTMSNVSTMALRHDRPSVPGPDRGGPNAIGRYVRKCVEREARIVAVIDAIIADGYPIFLWGVGTFTRRLFEVSALRRAKIAGIVDTNPHLHGKMIARYTIESPESLRSGGLPWPILIASVPFEQEIRSTIAGMGLANPVSALRWGPP